MALRAGPARPLWRRAPPRSRLSLQPWRGFAAKACALNAAKYDAGASWAALGKVAKLERYDDSTPEQILERSRGVAVLITKELPIGADLIARLPDSVKAICEAGTGYDGIDVKAARSRRIVVCNVPEYSSEAVATLAMTYMLNFTCSMFRLQGRLQRGERGCLTTGVAGGGGPVMYDLPHRETQGAVLGVVGGGKIGLTLMDLAKPFGFRVLAHDPFPGKRTDVEWVPLDALLAESDFVSLHCPLVPATRHLIKSESLRRMKTSAFLVNCSHGGVVKEEDLIRELRMGTIAGAALDVQEEEPVPPDSPLLDCPNLVLSPHIGWQRAESRQRLVTAVGENAAAVLAGRPQNVVRA